MHSYLLTFPLILLSLNVDLQKNPSLVAFTRITFSDQFSNLSPTFWIQRNKENINIELSERNWRDVKEVNLEIEADLGVLKKQKLVYI